ncbi:MAG: CehA/McbA family metallohydrolase [Pyrinomonadaceae bacterium]
MIVRIFALIFIALTSIPICFGQNGSAVTKWYKGNTHAHTNRSDGDSTPEDVAKWYRDNGYNFLFITDHEMITPVDELNKLYGKPGEYSIFFGQEVTDYLNKKPYHVNGLGVLSVTKPHRGTTIVQNLQLNIDSVRKAGGIPQVNHPNFGWALEAEQIAQLKNVNLMEIFNGHPLVNNLGGGGAPEVEQMWDKILSSGRLIFGLASDDVHNVNDLGNSKLPTPGHGWVMVNATELSQKAIMESLDRGDFYSSTGVELESYSANKNTISIAVKKERWSRYNILFIGRGGKVLAEFLDSPASYKLRGDEGYVRVKVVESNGKAAWTQPVMLDGSLN